MGNKSQDAFKVQCCDSYGLTTNDTSLQTREGCKSTTGMRRNPLEQVRALAAVHTQQGRNKNTRARINARRVHVQVVECKSVYTRIIIFIIKHFLK